MYTAQQKATGPTHVTAPYYCVPGSTHLPEKQGEYYPLFAIITCFTITQVAYALPEDGLLQNDQKNDVPHAYTVLPGTDEWLKLGSLENRRTACFVSAEEAESMTTRAIAETVVNYPFIIDMYAFDTLKDGIESVERHFSAIHVLMLREDAVEALKACSYHYRDKNDVKEMCAETLIQYLIMKNSINPAYSTESATYVQTPKGTYVPADYNRTWNDAPVTQSAANSLAYSYLQLYPSTTIIAMPSPKYNCHSYAWYSQQTSNPYWIDNPEPFVADTSYIEASKAAGRKVSYDTVIQFIHSGIVVTAGTTDSTTVVRSKWGCNALFSHNADDCPYYESLGSMGDFLLRYYTINPN